jgi:hypothetical protein
MVDAYMIGLTEKQICHTNENLMKSKVCLLNEQYDVLRWSKGREACQYCVRC